MTHAEGIPFTVGSGGGTTFSVPMPATQNIFWDEHGNIYSVSLLDATNGGMTRANGDRFRKMVLSRGDSEELETMFENWLGGKPTVEPMLRFRGLTEQPDTTAK